MSVYKYKYYIPVPTQNLLKNINTNPTKEHNSTIHSNIQTNNTTLELLNLNFGMIFFIKIGLPFVPVLTTCSGVSRPVFNFVPVNGSRAKFKNNFNIVL